ncbi:MAG: MBL fold metallo-hydrolase [Candidatus Hodarchaeales archaeon]|jgi:ribonuclease BN (tRNA processing enzyme)
MTSNNNSKPENFLHFIGTGNAFAEGGRFNASYWLTTYNNKLVHTLIDCGPTTLAGIRKFNLPFHQLNRIFISHYHGDHFAGIPFLLLDRAYLTPLESAYGSNNKFQIIGPPELEKRIINLIKAMYPSQMDTLLNLCEFQIIKPNSSFNFPEYKVSTFKANHSEQAIMYKFEFHNNSSFLYTGDNEMTQEQISIFKDLDFLITECTTFESQNGNHTSYKFIVDNLEIFQDLNVGEILLVHVGSEVFKNLGTSMPVKLKLTYDGMKLSLN